ncbi:M20/M25/M40 family metallo-hydrolase [Rhodovarius crocodyli]|uniref:M20/M25/M40 family metallo-hydrolase n=1 Tax=Rhodovarius crocodyli TaxID=1979269 RepID=A0A437M1K0_9PROT|nr:M20/M25/M40 family metallo-hydrolase [Rhodovarius crocodyli]RVT91589.1 M20/M25/M40 family metallo-hydrolase [Rhodovarius crocodyli]
MSERVATYLAGEKDAILERLLTLIRFPSVSTDPAFAEGMKGAREFLLDRLRAIGMQDVRLLEAPTGQPAVYGAWTGAGPDKPTIMVYGHYDVQPADPYELWTTPPFEPTIRDGRIYARGASDVKGSTTIAIETVAGFLAIEGGCPVNIKFFLEGEEEVGSPSLIDIIAAHRDLLAADAMISADGGGAAGKVPVLNIGCRGITALQFSLRTASKDAHSGKVGGAMRNALHEMARLVTTLHDEQGRVAVADFESGVAPLSNAVRAESASLPMDESAWYESFGAAPFGDPAYTVRERTTLRPTVEVNGMWGGYTGQGGKTVTPAEAHAKLTMRLVPGQEPAAAQAAVRAHLEAHAGPGVALEFNYKPGGTRAYTLGAEHPLRAATAAVLRREKGGEPAVARLGGTVPITTIFQEELGMDSLMFGLASADEDAHAPNEFFRLSSLEEGLRLWPLLLSELGKVPAGAFRDAS